mgnify:CR=1 FL=1
MPSFNIPDSKMSKFNKLKNMAANGTAAEKANAQKKLEAMFLKLPKV